MITELKEQGGSGGWLDHIKKLQQLCDNLSVTVPFFVHVGKLRLLLKTYFSLRKKHYISGIKFLS